MKPEPWHWWALTAVLGFLAYVAFLPREASPATVDDMPTVAASKKPAARPFRRMKSAVLPRRLTPPPGPSAREALADYPEPSPDFNAAAVESLIANRARR